MKILVLGGSYFLGKCFVNLAKNQHEITVFNRGNRPLLLKNVKEIHGDRHDEQALSVLCDGQYDAIVDFCAYQKNDIAMIFQALAGHFKQYIYVSTVDVYEHGTGILADENAPFETRDFGGEAGAYILGKVELEKELCQNALKYGIHDTSIRPSFIYGPDNYAPREGIYFHWIKQARQILHPTDATGEFQMVYVLDVARAILSAIGNPEAFGEAFNLVPDKAETYDSFADSLKISLDIPFEKVPVAVKTVEEKGIPLPFPLTKAESNLYDGKKALRLIDKYTELAEGMKKTLQVL